MVHVWMCAPSIASIRRKVSLTDQHNQLYINPEECIDCGACEPACPVAAIFEESAVPEQWRQYIKINADYYQDR